MQGRSKWWQSLSMSRETSLYYHEPHLELKRDLACQPSGRHYRQNVQTSKAKKNRRHRLYSRRYVSNDSMLACNVVRSDIHIVTTLRPPLCLFANDIPQANRRWQYSLWKTILLTRITQLLRRHLLSPPSSWKTKSLLSRLWTQQDM